MSKLPQPPDGDYAPLMNELESRSFSGLLGLRFTRATRDEVTAEMVITPKHHQPYGVVHGGVHASVIETLCSVGAGISALEYNKTVLGLENHTTFVRAARQGTLRARATPITRGRRTQVWETTVHSQEGELIATGRVRMLLLEADAQVAGTTLGFTSAAASAPAPDAPSAAPQADDRDGRTASATPTGRLP